MPLSPGERLGPYEIVAAIGEGGMGKVYRARDSRLGRDVALKVSSARFSDRFEREARAIAALNHPNICQIYDVGPNYLVMELLEGPTLSERLKKGAVPEDEAFLIARQIADALQAAHAKGIVHRDLKPGNITILPDGIVKVLDFGLAKVRAESTFPRDSPADPELSPTIAAATEAGMILGTAGYMSPEQARGKSVDKRADVWAFAVVLYEMLTGKRLFKGEDASETLAAVIKEEPNFDAVPLRVRHLLRLCLQKDPRKRLNDIGDAKLLLDEAPEAPQPAFARGHSRRLRMAWATAGLAGVIALAAAPFLIAHFREKPPAAQPALLQIIPEKLTFAQGTGSAAISPDGRWLAFPATGPDNLSRMWIRALDSLEVKPVEGSDIGAISAPPFWSFDSRFLAFWAGGKVKKIDIFGGPPQAICDAAVSSAGGAWNSDGVIIFGSFSGALTRVSAAGGPAAPMTILAPGESAHRWPQFLPDGRHFLYHRASRSPEKTGIFVGSIDAKPEEQNSKPLLISEMQATYVPSEEGGAGWLLFIREGTLLAQAFDPKRLKLSGDPAPVAGPVGSYGPASYAFYSVSATGVLVYRGGGGGKMQLTWFDPQGKPIGPLGEPGLYTNMAVSPDGKRVAVAQTNSQQGDFDIWVLDASRGTSTRLTFDPARDISPVWSPDGSRIAFASNRGGNFDLYQKAADGSGDDRLLLKSDENKTPTSWSRDGRFLLYQTNNPKTLNDLWVLPLDGDRKPISFLRTEFDEGQGQFSPDGHWIAYASFESGSYEVYVRPFSPNPGGGSSSPGGKWMVSKGGFAPHWRGDGKQLFYYSVDGSVMAVDVTTDKTFQAGLPKRLFGVQAVLLNGGDVTEDGKRFIFAMQQGTSATQPGTSAPSPFTVVLNWRAGLKK